MRKGLPKEEKDRVYHEAVHVRGNGQGLTGSLHWLDTDVIELEEPGGLLPLGEHYAMIRKLNGIKDVESVWLDNGARAEPGDGPSGIRTRGSGVRNFFRNFLEAWRFDDI